MKNWKNIQAIRVGSSWTIDINVLYDLEPVIENLEYFYGSTLLSGHNLNGLCFDCRYEPEGEPNGEFIIDFIQLETKHHKEKLLKTIKTKSKNKLVYLIEYFMFNEKVEENNI